MSKEKKILVHLPEELHKKLKMKCVYRGVSMQNYVGSLIKEKLEDYEVSPKKSKKV